MTLFEYLDRRADRRQALRLARIANPSKPAWHWPDARGWIGIGVFTVTVFLLWSLKEDPELRKDEWFQTIVTMIVTSGFLAVVAWAYSATKQGGELADRAAKTQEDAAQATVSSVRTNGGEQ